MENKTHWKKLINPDYLGAYSLDENEERILKIVSVSLEMVKGVGGKKTECTVANLENSKPMILNRTNCKIIASIHNTPYIEEWSGKLITVYATTANFAGNNVEALRIIPKIPTLTLPELTPSHKKWDGAMKSLSEGNVTIEQIKKNYSISQKNEELLCKK